MSSISQIKILSESTINQIAAGEVIERPLGVVRELVDNSIDAGAKNISIVLEQGGKALIEVADDGHGMMASELPLAFTRHATSKLRVAEDLLRISTKGFRGEALTSIAGISQVVVTSRSLNDSTGTRIVLDNGEISNKKIIPAAIGTIIEVKNLYYNTPARKKFLKSDKAESDKIKNWLLRYAIPHYQVRFKLKHNDSQIVDLPPRDKILDRAKDIFQGDFLTFKQLIGDITIEGMLAHPAQAVYRSDGLALFVNDRLVNDRILLKAIKDGFQSSLKSQETPLGFLYLQMPPSDVDVNIHPQKSEVRFVEGPRVFSAVRQTVLNSFNNSRKEFAETLPADNNVYNTVINQMPIQVEENSNFHTTNDNTKNLQSSFVLRDKYYTNANATIPAIQSEFKYSALRYIECILDCYLLSTFQDTLCVIDMHAAHERVNYFKIRNSFSTTKMNSQKLLFPLRIKLDASLIGLISEWKEEIESYGFGLQVKEDEGLDVIAAPSYFNLDKINTLFFELAEAFMDVPKDTTALENIMDKVAARLACHASIRSGDYINKEEVYSLFADLDSIPFNFACPHGRPIIVQFSQRQIEGWFGRDR